LFVIVDWSWGHFRFCANKKNKKTVGVCKSHISRSADFGWHMWLTPVVVMALPPHYLICLGVLFLPGGRMYGGSAGLAGNDFFFLLFLSGIACWPCKKSYQPFNLFFLWIQSLFLICNFFYLHWLFLIGFYFLFHLCLFYFWNLFSNLALIFLITICFVSNHFLDSFVFYHSTPRHLFSFNFCVKFGVASYNCYFLKSFS
jgi:hypothetical protein